MSDLQATLKTRICCVLSKSELTLDDRWRVFRGVSRVSWNCACSTFRDDMSGGGGNPHRQLHMIRRISNISFGIFHILGIPATEQSFITVKYPGEYILYYWSQ